MRRKGKGQAPSFSLWGLVTEKKRIDVSHALMEN
jgi:hypothetical protein